MAIVHVLPINKAFPLLLEKSTNGSHVPSTREYVAIAPSLPVQTSSRGEKELKHFAGWIRPNPPSGESPLCANGQRRHTRRAPAPIPDIWKTVCDSQLCVRGHAWWEALPHVARADSARSLDAGPSLPRLSHSGRARHSAPYAGS